MTKEEKLGKVVRDFSALPEDKQNLILAISQALAFAGGGRETGAEARPREAGETRSLSGFDAGGKSSLGFS